MPTSIDAQVSPEALLRSLVPGLGTARRAMAAVPLAGRCWEEPVPDSHCWKFLNTDPGARYDFWLLLTMRRLGPAAMTVSLVVPLEDGGLLHCVITPLYEKVVKTTLVQKLKQEHGSFGPVSVAKLKVRAVYEETQRVLFGNRFLSARFDAQGKLVEPYREVEGFPFPPLPQGSLGHAESAGGSLRLAAAGPVSVQAALNQIDLPDTDPLLSVRYPQYELTPDGEIEVEEGIVEGEEGEVSALADASGGLAPHRRPPGLYVDVTWREHPSLNLVVYSLQPEDGPGRILFADYCTGHSSDKLTQSITVKKKSSFFRKRKKITIVRKAFHDEGLVCGTLYDGGLAGEEEL